MNYDKVPDVKKKKMTVKKDTDTSLANVIFSGDTSDLLDYVWNSIILPNGKQTMSEVVKKGIDFLLYGKPTNNNYNRNNNGNGWFSQARDYSGMYRDDFRTKAEKRENKTFSVDYNFTFSNRGDAEEFLHDLRMWILKYDLLTVARYYDMLNDILPEDEQIEYPYTAHDYGWTELNPSTVYVYPIYKGYRIKLPKVTFLK